MHSLSLVMVVGLLFLLIAVWRVDLGELKGLIFDLVFVEKVDDFHEDLLVPLVFDDDALEDVRIHCQ